VKLEDIKPLSQNVEGASGKEGVLPTKNKFAWFLSGLFFLNVFASYYLANDNFVAPFLWLIASVAMLPPANDLFSRHAGFSIETLPKTIIVISIVGLAQLAGPKINSRVETSKGEDLASKEPYVGNYKLAANEYVGEDGLIYQKPAGWGEEELSPCQKKYIEYFKEIGSWPKLSDGRNAADVAKERCARNPDVTL
jgi:hypothetical protein